MNGKKVCLGALVGALALFGTAQGDTQTVWKFDNLSKIGGIAVTPDGHPKLVDSPIGKAVQFDGSSTLFFPERPLVGAKTFTVEAIFRPEGGPQAQRWMAIAQVDPVTGKDNATNPNGRGDPTPRYMFELRVDKTNWYLDAYVISKAGDRTLSFPEKLHPIGPWYAAAMTYDGKTFRSYVNGELQGEGDVAYEPALPGHVMVGARLNKTDYFTGSVAETRFTDRALKPEELLKAPKQ